MSEPCIVVTKVKTGEKSIHPTFKENFWLKKNQSPNMDIHVKIKHFDNFEEAEKFVDQKAPDYVPVDKANLEKVTAKIKEDAQAQADLKVKEAEEKAAKELEKANADNEAKLKKLQDKLDKLEAKNGSSK